VVGHAGILRLCENEPMPPAFRTALGRVEAFRAGGPTSLLALALGALAVGALAVGTVAIGQVVVGRMTIRRLRVQELQIGGRVITGDLLDRFAC
jgi:hypothetical protein